MKKIFLASQYVESGQNSTGYYFSRIIFGLKLQYSGVEVISAGPLFGSKEVVHAYFSSKSSKNRFLARVQEQLVLATRFLWRILRCLSSRDVLVTGTNPALMLPLIPILKKIVGFRWCLIVHDVFPENLVPAGIMERDSIRYRVLVKLFAWIYGSADRLIVIGRDMRELLAHKIGKSEKIVFLPNWACDKDVHPIPRSEAPFISELDWQDKIVFQFFGNIGRVQGVEFLLEAIALTKNQGLAFLFIGGGAMVEHLQRFIEAHPEINVAYAGLLPLDKKNQGLAACDIAIVSLEAGMSGLGVPSKTYFSMAADKPILAIMDNSAEISMVVAETGIGWQCEAESPEKLARIIDGISKDEILGMTGRSRAVLQARYSEERALNAYQKCIGELLEMDH